MIYAENRKAAYEYHFLETLTAGMVLTGKQASQIRRRHATLAGTYVVWQNHRPELINIGFEGVSATIPILLDKKEVDRVRSAILEKGKTVVALRIKAVRRWIKVDIAIAKGKTKHDKREVIKKRDLDRLEKKNLL